MPNLSCELPPFGEALIIHPHYGSGAEYFGADISPLTGFVGSSKATGTSDSTRS